MNVPFSVFMVCLLCVHVLNAQSITASELLFDDLDSISQSMKQARSLDKEVLGSFSVIDKWEFRTETDEWDIERQEYTVRASFNEFKSPQIYNQINNVSIETLDYLGRQALETYLYDRYKKIIEIYHLQNEIELLDSINVILEDKRIIAQSEMTTNASSVVSALIKLEFLQKENEMDRSTAVSKKKALWMSLTSDYKLGFSNLSEEDLIDLESIKSILEKNNETILSSDVILKNQKVKFRELEWNRQQQVARRILDFVQVRYGGRNDLKPFNDFSIGLGINIPTKSSNIKKRSEALLEMLEEELEYKQVQSKQAAELDDQKHKLMTSILEYESYLDHLKSLESQDFTILNSKMQNNPTALIEIKYELLKLDKDVLNLKNKVMEDYVDYLMFKGLIFHYPNVNFLQTNLNIE